MMYFIAYPCVCIHQSDLVMDGGREMARCGLVAVWTVAVLQSVCGRLFTIQLVLD